MTRTPPTNTQVYWDGYGIWNIHSGISVHARKLWLALSELNLHPKIVVPEQFLDRLTDCETMAIKPFWPQSISLSKLVWPKMVEARISSHQRGSKDTIIVHGLSNINLSQSRHPRVKKVLTVHDLIPLLVPESVSKPYYLQFKFILPRLLNIVDRVICVSQWTKNTLEQFFPQHAGKYLVIPNGFPCKAQMPSQPLPDEPNRGIDLLSVSRWEEYKNLAFLLNILRRSSSQLRLTIVTDSNGVTRLKELAADLIEQKAVKLQMNLSDAELSELYRHSDLYVHTSRYEGFCLPAAEALNHGLPVVYQSGSGIDETIGSRVGIGLSEQATTEDWVDAVEKASFWKNSRQFKENLESHLDSVATWKHSAYALLQCYQNLLEN